MGELCIWPCVRGRYEFYEAVIIGRPGTPQERLLAQVFPINHHVLLGFDVSDPNCGKAAGIRGVHA